MARPNQSTSAEVALPTGLFLSLSLMVGIWLIWDGLSVPLVTYAAYGDYWEHTAALTEWARNLAAPGNPHVVSADLSSRYMPYFWVLTWLGQTLDLNAVQLMSVSLVVNYCLIVTGLQLFLNYYFRDSWAPLIGFIAIFMLWGVGWNWSNLYQLRSFFYIGGYPSSFVFGLSLISFWVSLKLLRQDGSVPVLILALTVLAALMLLCHPLTGVFGIVGCALLALTEERVQMIPRVIVLAALAAGAVAAEIWPYFSVWKLMLGGYGVGTEYWSSVAELDPLERYRSGDWKHMFYNPVLMTAMLGTALLGIPVVFWLLVKRERLFIVAGAILMAVPYLAHLFISIPLAHRFILFVVIYLQFALVWFLLTMLTVFRAEPRPAYSKPVLRTLTFVIVAIVVANIALLAGEYRGSSLSAENFQIRDKRANLPEGQNVVDIYRTLTAPLDDDAVVLSTATLGWPLPTVKGKVVSLYHENPLLADQLERYEATGDFFYRPVGAQRRAEIVTRYNVSHVLLGAQDPSLNKNMLGWLDRYGRSVSSVGSYRMYRLLDSVPRIEAAPAPAESVVEDPTPDEGVDASAETVDNIMPPETDIPDEITPPDNRVEEIEAGTGTGEEAGPDEVAESDSSFGAPILAPIINVPVDDTIDDTVDESSEVSESVTGDEAGDEAPSPLPSAPVVELESAQESFGAPITEPIIEEPDGSPLPDVPAPPVIEVGPETE